MTLKYGQTTLEEIKAPIDALNAEIATLEAEKTTLEAELEATKNSFSLTVLDERKAKSDRLGMVNKALDNAGKYRFELIDGNAEVNRQKAINVINQTKQTEANAQAENVALIKTKMDEIKAIYADIKAYDKQVATDLRAFEAEVRPYLSEKKLAHLGMANNARASVAMAVNGGGYNDLSYIKIDEENGKYPVEKIVKGK